MKNLWPSGLALLAVTEMSLIGVGIVFVDLLHRHDFSFLHFFLIALFYFFPTYLWIRRWMRHIEVDGGALRFKSLSETCEIAFSEIEHIYITRQARSFVMSVHRFQHSPKRRRIQRLKIDFYNRDQVKMLLDELQIQQRQVNIVIDKKF